MAQNRCKTSVFEQANNHYKTRDFFDSFMRTQKHCKKPGTPHPLYRFRSIWGPFGSILGHFGGSWRPFLHPRGLLERLLASGPPQEASRTLPGASGRGSWALQERILGQLGPRRIFSNLKTIFFGSLLGPNSTHLGANLGSSSAKMVQESQLRAIWRQSECNVKAICM